MWAEETQAFKAGDYPVLAGQNATLYYLAQPGAQVRVAVYDLAGEQVARAEDEKASGRVELPLAGKAAGIYVVEVEWSQNGMVLGRQKPKLALLP